MGVLLIWKKKVGQWPTALAVGASGGCLDSFSLVYHFSFLSPSLWETVRYRLKYCVKGPLSPKIPTKNQHFWSFGQYISIIRMIEGLQRRGLYAMMCRFGNIESHCHQDWNTVLRANHLATHTDYCLCLVS